MNIIDIVAKAQDGKAIDNLAAAYGLDPAQARAVIASVVPQLAERIERNTLSRGGVADLVGMIGRAMGKGYLDDPAALRSEAMRQDGVGFLEDLLWSKDRSRTVAHRAAASSGISEAVIKQMLPTIAAMVMAALAKGSAGGLSDILARIPGLPGTGRGAAGGDTTRQDTTRQDTTRQDTGGWPKVAPASPLPGPSGGPMAGPPGGTGGGFGGQSPLPIPGGIPGRGSGGGGAGNPYDDLSDVIRRGGQSIPGSGPGSGPGAGGGLASVIRTILGALLGFQSRGVLSWILRYVVLRYGAGIVRWLLGRMLGRPL